MQSIRWQIRRDLQGVEEVVLKGMAFLLLTTWLFGSMAARGATLPTATCSSVDIEALLAGKKTSDVFPERGNVLTSLLQQYAICEASVMINLSAHSIYAQSYFEIFRIEIDTHFDDGGLGGCVYTEMPHTTPSLLTEHCFVGGAVITRRLW